MAGGGFRRGHGESDFGIRQRATPGVRRVVLRRAVRKAGRIPEQLAVFVREKREDADADLARRFGYDRPAGPEPGAVSGAETLRRGSGAGGVSAGAARISRREASAGPAEPHPRVVRQAHEGTVIRDW